MEHLLIIWESQFLHAHQYKVSEKNYDQNMNKHKCDLSLMAKAC